MAKHKKQALPAAFMRKAEKGADRMKEKPPAPPMHRKGRRGG